MPRKNAFKNLSRRYLIKYGMGIFTTGILATLVSQNLVSIVFPQSTK